MKIPENISISGKIGISWGHSGGEAGGLFTESYLAADGIENVIRVLEDMEDQKFTNLKFVELDACSGGCVGGVLTVENPYVAEVKLKHLRKYMPVARSHMDAETEEKAEELMTWTQSVEYEPVYNLGETMMESFASAEAGLNVLSEEASGTGLRSLRRAVLQGPGRGHRPGSGAASRTACIICGRACTSCPGKSPGWPTELEENRGGKETLNLIKEYLQRISDETSLLDKKEDEKDDRTGIGE